MHFNPFEPRQTVKAGFIGVGSRGRSLMKELLACDGTQVLAAADESEASIESTRAILDGKDIPQPAYFSGPDSWRKLLEMDLDLVYVATSWQTHTDIAAAVMESGKHAAVEVPAAETVEDCWRLVETSERTRRHCIMLENCCYDYWETLVKRMVRAGRLGTITHAECAYIHNLRQFLLLERRELWRRQAHIHRNGNLYPTHGLGPVAQCLDIGAGDAFDYLVSMNSIEAGLSEYRDQRLAEEDPRRGEVYRCGDSNVSLIRTVLGRTITLQHDVVTPRPYDRIFLMAGTKGTFRNYPPRLYLDEVTQSEETWLDPNDYRAEWEDPLWSSKGELARKLGGHGGMDFIMTARLVQCLSEGLPPDMDVYDAADWSVPGPLSELSAANRSRPVDFPDFRRKATAVQG